MTEQLGLTSEEAKIRLKKFGPNEIVPSRMESILEDIKKIIFDPMGLMLLSLAALHAVIGDKSDALILLAAYVPVTAIDVLLELRAQKALKAMRSSLSTKAMLIRDGAIVNVAVGEIVVGDVLVFQEGQSLPVDGRVLDSHEVIVNEAALTGESIPVEKMEGHQFFAGTWLMQGRGLGQVEKTGENTQFGKIASLLKATSEQKSPLQKKVNHILKYAFSAALGLAVFLFAEPKSIL